MYNVKWFEASGLYAAQGASSANSLFFETKADHTLFLELWEHFLGGMAELVHYSLTSVSWVIVFKTKTAEEINEEYKQWRERSKKAKAACRKQKVGEIISEHMRYFLSNYVLKSNVELGKDGSRVKKRFGKFAFETGEDYRDKIEEMEQMHKLYEQALEKYRADEKQYDATGEMENDDVCRSAKCFYHGGLEKKIRLVEVVKVGVDSSVLRQLLKSTCKSQNRFFRDKSDPENSKNPPDS